MSKFKTFRRKQTISDNCVANYESAFITEGTSAVKIYHVRLHAYKQAAIIITDKEGPDTSLVYTFRDRSADQELIKGDYYTWNNNTYLVYEDTSLVRETKYKKQKSYQCNVSCKCGYGNFFGYYVSSLTKYVDTTLQGSLNITDNEKPILVMPNFDWVSTGVKIVINGKPYKIVDFDGITNAGVAYCSLDRDFADRAPDIMSEIDEDTLIAGIEQEVDTNFGYFVANTKVEIVKKSNTKVRFIIPYGVEEITITTTDANSIQLVKKYKVVV